MSRQTYSTGDNLVFPFWLIFSRSGDIRLTRKEPSIASSERAVEMFATLPLSLWSTPMIRASITVQHDPSTTNTVIDLNAAADALKSAIGVDVDMGIVGGSDDAA